MEEESIIEWVEYHRSIGFEHFFIYGNDDDFRTLAETLAPYITSRIVTFTHCTEIGQQIRMYVHFLQRHSQSCEWICFLDQDEYLRLEGFHDNIVELTDRLGKAHDSIQFNWLNFGTAGYLQRPRGSVLRHYTRRSDCLDVNTKHITRARVFTTEGAISGPFWHTLAPQFARSCNVAGKAVSFWDFVAGSTAKQAYKDYVAAQSDGLIRRGCIAHYFLKSEADFRRRVERGLAGEFQGQIMYRQLEQDAIRRLELIERTNRVEDRYLAGYWTSFVDSLMRGRSAW